MNITKNRITGLAGALSVVALGLGGAAAGMAPANATVLDTDHPKVTESHFDFGKSWLVNAPQLGGDLTWNLSGGQVTVDLGGYLYLTNHECGRVHVDYYDEDHDFIDHRSSGVQCAPGKGKTQWWKSISFTDADVMHVHVGVQRQNSNGTFTTMGSTTADFN